MDKKPIQIGGLVALIVVALGLVIFFAARSTGTEQGARTAEQSQVLDALEKVGNDPNKLDPAMKAKFDQMNANNPFSSVNHYSQKPSGMGAPPSSDAPSGG